MPQPSKNYTKPKLRERIKAEIEASDKGGRPGQWSARKSQLLASEYEKRGGGYTTDKKSEAAKSLDAWTDQDWQTIDGDDRAREGVTTKRYLPKSIWEGLTEAQKREAERTKTTESRHGHQHVPWTPAIKKAFARLERGPSRADLYEKAKALDIPGRSKMTKGELGEAIAKAEG